MNQGSKFSGGSCSNRDNVKVPIQFRRENQPQPSILKDDFSSRTDPSIFTSIGPVSLGWSNENQKVKLRTEKHSLKPKIINVVVHCQVKYKLS